MKAYHTLVTGPSGSGKTTLLREMHAEFDGVSCFVTTKSNESGVAGKRVRGRQALDTAVTEAAGWSDVRVKWYDASYPQDLETVRQWAHDLTDYAGCAVQIIVDEAQNSELSKSQGPLKEGLHEDRDRGIKWVPATQSPQDLREGSGGYKGINQCRYIVWVGDSRVFQSGFISYYQLDDLLPSSPYRYHVVVPSNPPEVVFKGMTDRRYS